MSLKHGFERKGRKSITPSNGTPHLAEGGRGRMGGVRDAARTIFPSA
jgi:hypothetical protein